MSTVRVQPWGSGQGEFVVIDAADFDPSVHKLLGEEALDAPLGFPGADEQAKTEYADGVIKAANADAQSGAAGAVPATAPAATPKKGKG